MDALTFRSIPFPSSCFTRGIFHLGRSPLFRGGGGHFCTAWGGGSGQQKSSSPYSSANRDPGTPWCAATRVSSFSQTPGLEQLGSIPCVPIAVKPLHEAFIERGHFQSSSACVLKIKETLVREENTHTGGGRGRNLNSPGSSELGPPVEGGTRGTRGRQLCLATQPGAVKSKPDPTVSFFSTTKEVHVHFFLI